MITMRNFRVLVPTKDEALLGYTGENLSRRFEITVDDPGAWAYKLDVRNEAGVANIIDLMIDGNVLYTEIERAALQVSGKVTAQIRAIDGDKVKCSNTFWLFIGDSVEAVACFESLPPSEFEQMEARMTAIRDEVEQMAADLKDVSADVEAAQTAAQTATEAAGRAEAAAADVEQAVSDAAGAVREQVAADADRAEEAANNAQSAADTAAQDAAAQVEQNLGSYVTNAQNAAQDAETAKTAAETAQAAAEKAAEEASASSGGGVTSFNGRGGAVTPQKGDYSADDITFEDGETFQQKYDSGELKGGNGDSGTSVTVTNVSESTADGGENVVTFSDGKTLTVKNGSKGSDGAAGKDGNDGYTPVKGTDYFTDADKTEMVNEVNTLMGAANTDYSTVRARGIAIVADEAISVPNGCLCGVYTSA